MLLQSISKHNNLQWLRQEREIKISVCYPRTYMTKITTFFHNHSYLSELWPHPEILHIIDSVSAQNKMYKLSFFFRKPKFSVHFDKVAVKVDGCGTAETTGISAVF